MHCDGAVWNDSIKNLSDVCQCPQRKRKKQRANSADQHGGAAPEGYFLRVRYAAHAGKAEMVSAVSPD